MPKEENEDKLGSIDRSLKEILKWTRFANISKLKATLEKELDSDQKKLAYEYSDGTNALREISELSGAPKPTIATWWPRWYRLGLVIESELHKGRMMKVASLDDVGIDVPKKKTSSNPSGTQSPQPAVDQPAQDPQQPGGSR